MCHRKKVQKDTHKNISCGYVLQVDAKTIFSSSLFQMLYKDKVLGLEMWLYWWSACLAQTKGSGLHPQQHIHLGMVVNTSHPST